MVSHVLQVDLDICIWQCSIGLYHFMIATMPEQVDMHQKTW